MIVKLKIYLAIMFFCVGVVAQAQVEPYYKSYDWDSNPEYHVSDSDTNDMITYKEKAVKEFFFNDKDELAEYDLEHQIIWLNSDKQIEENNKIYLPYSESSDLLVNKARVITKDGKVIVLDDSKILTAEDEETKRRYKYYTFEGVEKGSFIEFLYVFSKYPDYKGARLLFQSDQPKYDVDFDLFAPENLIFKFKSYNGFDSISVDTTAAGKLHWMVHSEFIPALEEEDQSPYNSLKQCIVYKLDQNLATRSLDISSYGKAAKNAYSFLYDNATKGETKALGAFLKKSKAMSTADEQRKIRMLEDYVKKTILHVDAYNDELTDITYILEQNMANKSGLTRLYARLFKLMDVKTQLVMTCDGGDMKFDSEFESNNFLEEYLFYFPDIKSYMSPVKLSSRLGFPPPELTHNNGLFIKEVSMGDFSTGIGKIKYIDPVEYDQNFDYIVINLHFDENDLTRTEFEIEKSIGGYYAMYAQPYMHLFDEKTIKELLESYIKYLNENMEIVDQKVYNDNAESFGIQPLRIEASISSEAFAEKAGNKYLFKVGELIGPQMEMYQKKKRTLPLETQFNRNYHREITFTIPDGFKINNLDDISIDNNYVKDGETLFKFSSSYRVDGNKISVVADEYYKIIEIAPEIFEEYRKVVNSAADFNKVTLVIEPM